MRPRVRIAPSPTGEDLHIGNVYTALINWVFAQKNGGKFILRIEDTDRQRLVEGSEERILASLKWLGINYDEGPDIGGPYKPYRQSERLPLYKKYAEELIDKGGAYYCFCTPQRLDKMRQEQMAKKQAPTYDRTCRRLDPQESKARVQKGESYVIRLKVPEKGETKWTDLIRGEIAFKNSTVDDTVLLKSDGYPTYHLGVVVDDHLMEITHVIRAEEWISSTPKHLLLYQFFNWKAPEFAHLPLLRNPDRSKLSKRRNPVWVSWYRQEGYLPEAILNFLALLGWSHPQGLEVFPASEMIKNFSLKDVLTSAPVFNLEKLTWLNGVYIRNKSPQELLGLIKNWAKDNGFKLRANDDHLMKILPLVQERMKKLSEFGELSDFFFLKPEVDPKLLTAGKTKGETKAEVAATLEALKTVSWQKEEIEKKIRQVAVDLNIKPPHLFMTLRIALTGKTATPPLFETMEVLGKEEVLLRLEKILTKL